mgnify:CR=1 FL=1
MEELVHNDVLHAHRLEGGDRKPAGQDFARNALAHQSHGHAQANQPVGHESAKEGEEEAHASQGLVLLLNVDLIESHDLLGHGIPDRRSDVVSSAIHGAAGEADGHDHGHNGGADPVADPHPDPVAEGGTPGALAGPGGHRQQRKVAGHQLHPEQHDAGEAEGEQQRAHEGGFDGDAHGEGQDHRQAKDGSGVKATDQQVLHADR